MLLAFSTMGCGDDFSGPTHPSVRIAEPVDNSVFTFGTPIRFVGVGYTVKGGVLNTTVGWLIDTYPDFSYRGNEWVTDTLSVGRHVVTAKVSEDGRKAEDHVRITIAPN